jgi:hypothetical protein
MALPNNEKLNQKDELQILQDRISSGNMQLSPEEKQTQDASKITEQLAISRGDAPQVTPQIETPQIERKPEYLGDYSKDVDLVKIAKNANVPLQNVFADYQRWGNDTGNPTDFLRIWTAAQKGDITKTPQEIEAEEKKLRGQERMEKFANFLTHLGNFVGAVGWGGSVQGLETPKELTARQQALRDKTEALRTAYNKSYFENYYKQRADEINQQKLKLAQRQQDQRDAQQYLNERRFELDEKIKNGTLDLKKLEYELKQKVAEGRLTHQAAQDALGWARNALGWAIENRQASGTVTETHKKDKYGKDEVVRVEKKPGNAANNSNTSGNSLGIHVNKGGGNSLGIHVNKK